MNTKSISVINATKPWLPKTANWLYEQIKYLPLDIKSYVVCKNTENLDQFNLDNIFSLCGPSFAKLYTERVTRKLGIPIFQFYLKHHIRRLHSQLLHSHFGNYAWENYKTAQSFGLPHCVTFYGFDVNALPKRQPVWRTRYLELFENIDQVLCEGPYMAQSIVKLGCPENKVKVHHLGVNLSALPYQPRKWNGENPLKILISATFREKKGIPIALEALAHVKSTIPLEITIIGDASINKIDQEEKRKIMDTISRHNMHNVITLLGFQSHATYIKEAYKHHVFVSPSITASDGDTEGGAPVSLIEMAASGMPIVSTKHCDIPEVIRDGETGLLSDERDVDAVAENILWLVNNQDIWPSMLEAGRTYMETEFDVVVQSQRLAAIYASLV